MSGEQFDAMAITGSRPPSAQGVRTRPPSASRRSRNTYKVVSTSSNVDELLFGSSNPKTCGHDTAQWEAPWCEKKKPSKTRSSPNLWTPAASSPGVTPNSSRSATPLQGPVSSGAVTPSSGGMKNKSPYKLKKFKESYVDESLFGPQPVECDFPAPWDKDDRSTPKPLLWTGVDYNRAASKSPAGGNKQTKRRPGGIANDAPVSSRPASSRPPSGFATHRPMSASRPSSAASTSSRPVWR